MRIGSLFTGIGGLELGVCDTVTSIAPYGNDIEWIAETDGNALKLLEHSTMFHGVPNRSRMDGRKSPGYSKRPSFYDLKQWSDEEVRASYGAAIERWEGVFG